MSNSMIDPRPYFFDGLQALQQNDLEQALELFSMAHTLIPEQSGINYAMSEAYLRMGDLTSAAYHAKAAVRADSTNKWYWLRLSQIYRSSSQLEDALQVQEKVIELDAGNETHYMTQAALQQSLNRPEEALESLQQALKVGGPSQNLLANIYQLQLNLGLGDDAIDTLKEMLNQDPTDAEIRQELAQAYIRASRFDEAVDVFEQRLQQNPNDIGSALLLIETLFGMDRPQEAITWIDRIWESSAENGAQRLRITQFLLVLNQESPDNFLQESLDRSITWIGENQADNPQALALAIDYYQQAGRTDEALPLLEKLTQANPANDMAWRQYLQLLYTQSRFEEVVEKGKQANENVPQDPYITFFVGSSLQIDGKEQEALAWLQESASIPADRGFRSIVYGSLGDVQASLEQWEEAFSSYKRSLRFDAENETVLNNYAYFMSISPEPDLELAEEMATKANELRPGEASFLDTLGWIYHLQGKHQEAEKWIMQAVEAGEASATVMEHLGDVYEALNEPDKAKVWWKKALEKDSSRTHLESKVQ